MTHQELQALLHDTLAEIADIKVTMKRLASGMHSAMNTSAWYSYSEKYYRAYDLLTRKKEDVAILEARYYTQFSFTVEQCADIGLPSGVTNFYGQDLY
jgi:hypothetical protein|tara:strand:- start:2038 stop:2331 length:294 start_codon:yes stop_codon:yes gene_type:complete